MSVIFTEAGAAPRLYDSGPLNGPWTLSSSSTSEVVYSTPHPALAGQDLELRFTGNFEPSLLDETLLSDGATTPGSVLSVSQVTLVVYAPATATTMNIWSASWEPEASAATVGSYLAASSNADFADALDGNDTYVTPSESLNAYFIFLWGGNDRFIQNRHPVSYNDSFYGGDGTDTAVFGGQKSDFNIHAGDVWNQLTGTTDLPGYTISDRTGRINTTEIQSVERIEFTDGGIAYDLDGNAGQVAKLLGAVFGSDSVTNVEYVGIGLDLLDGGMSYTDLAALAVSVTGKSSSTDVCNLLWENVIGSPATAADIAPFKAMLDSNQFSIGQLTTLAADTSFNALNVDLVGLAQTGLEYV